MADSHRRSSAVAGASRRHPQQQQQQQSRLQRRAPASLQINRSDWNVAIPLLSPLVSPSSPNEIQSWTPADSREGSSGPSQNHHHHKESEPEKPPVFKKWQHPAAPFNYDSGPRAPRFVPV